MASARREADGMLLVHLDDYEADVVRSLMGEMSTLLNADLPRSDAVVARLFPDAYDDPDDAEKYRSLIGGDLSASKKQALSQVETMLGESGPVDARLSVDDATAWLTVVTDLRLAIGARLEVTEETMNAEIDPNESDGAALAVLHWLGWLQEITLAEMQEAQ